MGEGNLPICAIRQDGMFRIPDNLRHIQIVKYPGEEGHGPDPVHLDIEELVDRTIHFPKQSHQDGDITYGQAGIAPD